MKSLAHAWQRPSTVHGEEYYSVLVEKEEISLTNGVCVWDVSLRTSCNKPDHSLNTFHTDKPFQITCHSGLENEFVVTPNDQYSL